MKLRFGIVLFMLFLIIGMSNTLFAQWTVTFLNPPNADGSYALGVSGGQQVGYIVDSNGPRAGTWTGTAGSWANLQCPLYLATHAYGISGDQIVGDVGGGVAALWRGPNRDCTFLAPTGSIASYAYGVGGGQQVGFVYGSVTNYQTCASLWSGTAASWVNLNPEGMTESVACGVSDGGVQVGYVKGSATNGRPRASVWNGSAASWMALYSNSIESAAYGIWGTQVVGYLIGPSSYGHKTAFMWNRSGEPLATLHPEGYSESIAYGCAYGTQVGAAGSSPDSMHAGVWSGTSPSWTDLHVLLGPSYSSSEAKAVEVEGEDTWIVGYATETATSRKKAVMWHYSTPRVETPTFSPDGGRFTNYVYVYIRGTTPGATMRYTTDGEEPTETSPILSVGGIGISRNCISKAKAFKYGMLPSETKSAQFTIVTTTPSFGPNGGPCAEPQNVIIGSSGSTIYYTLDGQEPTTSSPSMPSGSRVMVDHPLTLRAVALRPGCELSDVRTAEFSFREPLVWYVRTDGSDLNDGTSWSSAKQSIAGATYPAVPGDEVWVASGTYGRQLFVEHGIKLYGGFAGTESALAERDLKANRTTLYHHAYSDSDRAIELLASCASPVVIDGFTIESPECYYGISCRAPLTTIRNNRFIATGYYRPTRAIYVPNADSVEITNNLFVGQNTGVYYHLGKFLIASNTMVGNGYAVYGYGPSVVTVANNIIAFNGNGIRHGTTDGSLTLDHNCVFGNTHYDYYGSIISHPTDINVDPLFQDMAGGDYRLRWDSPCIDAGTNEGAPTTDIEGSVRPMDGNHDGLAIADIGAYESPMPIAIDILADSIRLQPKKLIQVAILSDPIFNALNVDPMTVVFGPGQAKEIHGQGHLADVNGDGLTDLLFHFSCAESGIVPGYQTVNLVGKLVSGEDIISSDGVTGIMK